MKATLYAWEGTPSGGHQRAIGEVRLGEDARSAVWDPRLDAYFDPLPIDPRTGSPLDPAFGEAFIRATPYVFRSPPYTWAEESG